MDEPKPPAEGSEAPQDEENALETPDAGAAAAGSLSETPASGDQDNVTDATNGKGPKTADKKKSLGKFNIYILFFAFIIVLALVIVAIAYFQSKKAATTATVKTQTLTQNALNQVADSDSTVGANGEVLNVESSAVFAGEVLVKSNLEVAGNLEISSAVALSALTVSGTTQLGQLQVNQNLSVNGDTGIQGALTVAKSLQVNGTASFSGSLTAPQITTNNFELDGDLVLIHHLVAGGATPGQSNGPALGSGGTASVSGSDTSGSVSINTGGSPSSGCFITINFATAYNSTPHVVITPVGAAAGGLAYYVERTTTNFEICDASTPPSGSNFGFDYLVLG